MFMKLIHPFLTKKNQQAHFPETTRAQALNQFLELCALQRHLGWRTQCRLGQFKDNTISASHEQADYKYETDI